MARKTGFHRNSDGLLCVDGIALNAIAKQFGTPLFVYSAAAMTQAWQSLANAFLRPNRRIYYAMKANSNLAVLRLFQKLGAGVDIVSLGELRRALAAGFAGEDIVFSGVGKTEAELRVAIEAGVGQINAESEAEIDLLIAIGKQLAKKGKKPNVAIRINADTGMDNPIIEDVSYEVWHGNGEVDIPSVHPDGATRESKRISTRGMLSKFGIEIPAIEGCYRLLAESGAVTLKGLAVHAGSQIKDSKHFLRAWRDLRKLADSLRKKGFSVPSLDLGGGIGVDYETGTPPDVANFVRCVDEVFGDTDYALACEPGRMMVAEAGCLMAQVIHNKATNAKQFITVDAGMNDLIRPTLYDAYHRIEVVHDHGNSNAPKHNYLETDVVGPICEIGDFLARSRDGLSSVKKDDYLAVMSTGAYGAVMRSRYNSRPLASEVMVVDGKPYRISQPDSIDAMLASDIIPPPLVPDPAV